MNDADSLDLQQKLWEWCDQAKGGDSAEERSLAASLIVRWLPRFLRPRLFDVSRAVQLAEAKQAFLIANHRYLVTLMDYADARISENPERQAEAECLREQVYKQLNALIDMDLRVQALEPEQEEAHK